MDPEVVSFIVNGDFDQPRLQGDLLTAEESSSTMMSPPPLCAPSMPFLTPICYNNVSIDPASNDREMRNDTAVYKESISATATIAPVPALEPALPLFSPPNRNQHNEDSIDSATATIIPVPALHVEPPLLLFPPPIRNHHNEDSFDSSGIGSVVGSLCSPETLDGVADQLVSLGVMGDIPASSTTPNDRCKFTASPTTSSIVLEQPTMNPAELKTKTKRKQGRGRPKKNSSHTASVKAETEVTGNQEAACPWPLDAVFDIEALVDRRKEKGVYRYLVKWSGYPSSANSWEPRTSLMDMCHGIVDYYDKLKEKTSKRVAVTVKQYDQYVLSKVPIVEAKAKTKSKHKQPALAPAKVLAKRLENKDELQNLGSGVLKKVPHGRKPEKIIGVTVDKGQLLYLVQWQDDKFTKTKAEEEYEEGLTSNNTNVILASAFQKEFPQLAIEMYQSKVVMLKETDPGVLTEEQNTDEAEKALERKRLRLQEEENGAVEGAYNNRLKMARRSLFMSRIRGDCELVNDEAALAIAKEKKMKDRFDPDTSSSEDSDLDDQDGLDVLMDEPDEVMAMAID